MEKQLFKPYVPEDTNLAELTIKAVLLGVIMAAVLGAANAYVGMKVGLTVAATFPAAVVAMAALKPFKGTILEENIARTTASVGEALVAGAIFTLPAFVISGVWDSLQWKEATLIMLVGGTLGVLFVIILRRTLVEDTTLAFPESVAASEIVKAGQAGASGASYVFSGMGIAALWELFKNDYGIRLVSDHLEKFFAFTASKVGFFDKAYTQDLGGGMLVQTPAASPMLMGVGYIVGLRVSAVLFAGAVFGWWLLVPLAAFLNPELANIVTEHGAAEGLDTTASWTAMSKEVWYNQIRPLAVGTMIVSAFYTLFNLRHSLIGGIKKAVSDLSASKAGTGTIKRTETDLDFKKVFIAILVLAVPMFLIYNFFSGSFPGALMLTAIMLILGFLFAAVAGYLVGLIGSSNNPISGLTLSTLLISAVLMLAMGITGPKGVMAVLGIAGVICCAAGIAGDMMQDLKVGQILGGTPRRMETAEIIGVIFASLVLIWPMIVMDKVYGIGTEMLPAPQAGLMAMMAEGIVGGEMSWPLVIVGMLMAFGLILIGAPSPMLIAVGMYLPFTSTCAIFIGGIIRYLMERSLKKRNADEATKTKAQNTGILLSSGFIAGESLMAVIMAFVVLGRSLVNTEWEAAPIFTIMENPWVGMLAFLGIGFILVRVPIQAALRGNR
jgi:putative OPT family oligopeptide transporter